MVLPRGLKRGAFVELDERDIAALTSAVGRSEARADPRGPRAAAEPGNAGPGENRPGRGPRRNDRSRGGRVRPDAGFAGAPDAPARAVPVDAGRDDGEEGHDPLDLQPPLNRNETPRDGNRRRGAKGPGNRGNSGGPGPAPRSGPPGKFGGNFGGQGPKRRDDRGDRSDKTPGGAQPDPMKTSFGYIGADTFTRQRQAPGQGQRRGGSGGGGGGGGNGPRRGGGGNRSGGGNRGGNR